LYRASSAILTGLDGTPLTFAVSEPRSGTNAEYLFVSGSASGGRLKKVDTSGIVTNWGIAAPASGAWATEGESDASTEVTVTAPQSNNYNSTFFSSTSGWTVNSLLAGNPTQLTLGTTGTFDGDNYLILSVGAAGEDQPSNSVIQLTKAGTINLAQFLSTDASSGQDFIRFEVRSQSAFMLINKLSISFLLGTITGSNELVYDVPISSLPLPASTLGVTDVSGVADGQDTIVGQNNPFDAPLSQEALLQAISASSFIRTAEWQQLSIPKSLFVKKGNDATLDFSDVVGLRFTVGLDQFGGGVNIHFGGLDLVGGGRPSSSGGRSDGGGGVQGTYKYKVTFRNATTGNRSNGSPATIVARSVNRGYITLSNIPTSPDSQVTQREIWRTVGNGNRFFKIGVINDNTTTTFVDEVADFAGLDDTATRFTTPDDFNDPESIDFVSGIQVMSSLELPTDNDVPDADFDDHIIDRLVAFWLSSGTGKQGRLYFSPIGRPESKKGFINISSDGNPLHKLVTWADGRYVVAESNWYQIDGTDPYIAREIKGVPGVQFAQRRTVVPTPFGVVWQAVDGIRLFNGRSSTLLNPQPIGLIFQGEAAEQLSAFEGIVATFARDEYIISSGTQSLAFSMTEGTWRDLGYLDITALDYESDTGEIHAGRASSTQIIENEGTITDAGAGIPFAIESPAQDLPDDGVFVIEDVFVDIDASGQTVTPSIVHRDGTLALTTFAPTSRTKQTQALDRLFQLPGLRLTATASDQIIVYGAEFQVRPLELGITRSDTNSRIALPGRSTSLASELIFDIPPQLRELDELNTVYFIERLIIEADTNGSVITPIIDFENTSLTLSTISSTSRSMQQISVERMGPITALRLQDNFTDDVQIFGIELVIRPVLLDVVLLSGERMQIDGYSTNAATSIVFDLEPFNRQFAGTVSLPIIDNMTVEANTAGLTVTSVITCNEGVSFLGPSIQATSRQQLTKQLDRLGRVNTVTLSANFAGASIALYSVELVMRPLTLQLVLDGQ
jgi:hypothetical protein